MRNLQLLILLLIPLVFTGAGCFEPNHPSPWNPPGIVNFVETMDVNRFMQISGAPAFGQQTTSETDFDLHFYAVGSSEVFGLRSGWHLDEYDHPIPLRIMDLGETAFEDVEYLPMNGTRDADYKPISTSVIYSTAPDAGNTLLKLNHVYAIFRWNTEGGYYLKLFVQRIDPPIARIQVRGSFQTRQGINLVWPSDVPY